MLRFVLKAQNSLEPGDLTLMFAILSVRAGS